MLVSIYYISLFGDSEVSLKYILAILNSKLYYQWLYHRGKRKGETLELYQKPLSEVPINKISHEAQKPFVDLIDKILSITLDDNYNCKKPSKDQKKLEHETDRLVYQLYDLTDEEIAIVEKASN